MKLKVIPNRTIPEKKKSTKNKSVVDSLKQPEKTQIKESGIVPTKFQYDDDFDNWFPWEIH
jgi:hypothetical protein